MCYRISIINKLKYLWNTGYIQVFTLNFLIAVFSLGGLILSGNGVFTLCNDFNEQQIPFHMLANSSIKNGQFLWNWSIDLGSSFVGALGFYVLGSPFAWISFLFPAKLYPYVTGWLYMMKYAAAGALAYGYIKRFAGRKYAVLGSVLYAFSGFQCVNLIFHHFHDAVAFFPLLLIGYEKLAREGKKGMLAIGVCVNAFVNYYFFIQEVIFLILYFLCREGIKIWKKRKLIGRCFAEGILGIGMAGVLFIPSVLFTMQNPRLTRFLAPDHWFYSGNRDYLQVLRTLLFPGELMCSQSCIKEYDWSSWSAYLPMVGITFVICYIIRNRKDWLSKLMIICLVATGIPVVNSIFGLFSDTNYHRWLYMLILLMSLASAVVMENRKNYHIKAIAIGLTVFMTFIVAASYWWSAHKFELINQQIIYFIWSAVGIAGVLSTCFIAFAASKDRVFFGCMACGILSFSIFTTGMTAKLYHNFSNQNSGDYYDRIMAFQEFTLPDERYRILSNDNTILMTALLPGTGSFTSMVNGSIYEFYESLGTSRPVFTPEGPAGTKELLGGKYYFTDEILENAQYLQKVFSGGREYYLYEAESAVPIGSAYDSYITYSNYKGLSNDIKAIIMLDCIVIPDEKEAEVSKVMKQYKLQRADNLSAEDIYRLVKERCKEASVSFVKRLNGFESVITTSKEKYAFFSVPYDEGFCAYVNDKKVDILKANGMMAIPLEAGVNKINFIYFNYDLLAGLLCSVLSIILWNIYKNTGN